MSNIGAGSLVFDIGAFKGEYTEKYLKLGARVTAVEAQRSKAEELRNKFEGMKVTVVEAAVGAKEGSGMLFKTQASWLASLCPERWKESRFKDYTWQSLYEVRIVTLDWLIEQFGKPDFVKIDVEGGEQEAIAGLSQPVKELSYEFSKELLDEAEECGRMLSKIGNYEFAISYYWDDKPGEYTDLEKIMKILRADETPLLWGNIYVRIKNG